MAEQTPPIEAVDAENAVLGALLIDPHAIATVANTLAPGHFWRPQNKWIYGAMLRLHTSQVAIDLLTLSDYLESKGYLDKVGGPAYITGLSIDTPTSIHVRHYADLVIAAARRRKLVDVAARIAEGAYDRSLPLTDLLARADQAYYAATADMVDDDKLSAEELMSRLYDEHELVMARGGVMGVPTGLADVDELLGGMHKTDLIYMAARPAVGKTAVMLNVALSAAKQGKKVLIISLEMSAIQLAQRLACIESGLQMRKVRRGQLDQDEYGRLLDAMNRLSGLPIHVIWTGTKSPAEIRATARKHAVDFGLDLLCVDYLQLMSADNDRRNRREQIDEISRALKLLAKDLDIVVLANSQLSRAVEARVDKRPLLSDLRESGGLEQDADVVIFLYRQEMYEPEVAEAKGRMEWIVAKHRNGPTGTCYLMFRGYNNQVVGTKVESLPGGLQRRMPIDELIEEAA